MMENTFKDILFEEVPGRDGKLGLITLNRQQALNALNHPMFIALGEHLEKWNVQTDIKAVVIKAAEGRAFCAGGDIRYAYELHMAKDPSLVNFFGDEYRMNSCIHHFNKPYIALEDGITMGGGVGLSIHASHRIGTERLIFAMPETGIGFYPDVGTTYYLARLKHKIGYYLGLTGARIDYADCYAIGVVDEIVAHDSLPKILSTLTETSLADKNAVTQLLKQFAIPVPESQLTKYTNEIETCFSKNSVDEIIDALEKYPSEWCQKTAELLKTRSPTSLKITFRALQKAEKLSFDECMKMEYNLTCNFINNYDFFEGIRAVIIDKDQKPRWKPATLSEVTTDEIEEYFKPMKNTVDFHS